MKRICLVVLLLGMTTLSYASLAETPQSTSSDVVALVGDQPITFTQINTMLNSSAVVGLSIPALGTPQRDRLRIMLLDKIVSANLIYLDALRKGVDKRPEYRDRLRRFENNMLAGLYKRKEFAADDSVSEEEVQKYYKESVIAGTELTDELRTQIEAVLRKRKADRFRLRLGLFLDDLRRDAGVTINEQNIDAEGDADRSDDAVVATLGKENITWGEVKSLLIASGKRALKKNVLAMEEEGRKAALNSEINTRLLADQARNKGMDQDPLYKRRLDEYRKTRLINMYRTELAKSFEPDDKALAEYYEANKAKIMVPEARKAQMVVVKTQEQAQQIKDDIENGETTMYKAARDFSIDPGASHNLGEIGWVLPGEGQPPLNKLLFELGPDEIGGPVETPAGWHLLKVLDVREEQFADLSQPATRKRTRRAYIHHELDQYTVNLRLQDFKVKVFQDRLIALAQAEADMVRQLADKGKQPGSVTQTRLEEMQKVIKQP